MEEGLTTAEVARAAGLTPRQLAHLTAMAAVVPDGTGDAPWAFDQVRVVILLATLWRLGASADTLAAVAPTAAHLAADGDPGVWGATMLVTPDGRMLAPLRCNEDGYLVRLSRCRDLAIDVRRVQRLQLLAS